MGAFVDMLALQIKEREQRKAWCRTLPPCQLCREELATFFGYPVPGKGRQLDICESCRASILAEVYGGDIRVRQRNSRKH